MGTTRISSSCGVQQGDPLGPLLFALALHKVSHSGSADLTVWYLDDGTIGGPAERVAAEAKRIKEAAATIGLQLNERKCEAVSSDSTFAAAIRTILPDCSAIDPAECELLGAAVGASAVATSLAKRTSNFRDCAQRLASVDRHDALALLRVSLGHPRANYELRADASFRDPEALAAYDASLRDTAELALNIRLNDRAWLQCTLPPLLGGIGIRAPSDLALSAFIASSEFTGALASQICHGAADSILADARTAWSELTGTDEPTSSSASTRSWQRPLDAIRRERLISSLETPRDIARLHSTSTPESAALLLGLPCSREGTRLTDIELSATISLRLGLPVAAPGICECRQPLDALGDHALSCNHGVERHRRHDELNSRIRDILAKLASRLCLSRWGSLRATLAASTASRSRRSSGDGRWPGTRQSLTPAPRAICTPLLSPPVPPPLRPRPARPPSTPTWASATTSAQSASRPWEPSGPRPWSWLKALATRLQAQSGDRGTRARIFRRLGAAVQAGNARRIIEAHAHSASGVLPRETEIF